MHDQNFRISRGFPDDQRNRVAGLFWQAFQEKLRLTLGPDKKALAFIGNVVNPDFAISATNNDGQVVGVAGYKTQDGGFVGGELSDLANVYGWIGALWRGPLLSLLERDLESGSLLMDGIFVDDSARGQGIGTSLLTAIKSESKRRGLKSVRLDVIDSNPRARALYERRGFVAEQVQTLGPLKMIFQFQSATQMTCKID